MQFHFIFCLSAWSLCMSFHVFRAFREPHAIARARAHMPKTFMTCETSHAQLLIFFFFFFEKHISNNDFTTHIQHAIQLQLYFENKVS